ncbi:MAG: valine--tRNA ligase [Gemmatimonadota bacterium]|nr:MAG: valine--tRNA ligase [Gemmatimonadota bacterium]
MTTLAPQYDPLAIEGDTYQRWLDAGIFAASTESGRTPYVIMIPPPNVTAVLHSGHGLNNTLQDVLIRFERMRGREALWLPGTDHAGIATQNVVERMLDEEGKSRQDLGRVAFVERVWQHVHETGGTILEQLKALGCSCDWSRTRFTLDEDYSHAVRKVFVDLFHDGLIYRGQRVIHWCPRCRTSLSDEEAEFHDRDDHLYYIRYNLVGGAESPGGPDSQTDPTDDGRDRRDQVTAGSVTVATTRPETMFGDVCLVFHPEDDRFQSLNGATVAIPLSGIHIPVRTSTVVERDFGTGMLKVTPAHDANDFEIADALGGFERPVTMDEDARMTDDARVPSELHGLDRFEARDRILELLRETGQLEKVEPYHHSVRHCYRCKTIVEPRLSDQWFVKMRPLAEPALRAYREGRLRFIPERWGKVYEHWLTQIRDWNISRQLWWGHRIPAWFCNDCDHITVALDEPSSCERCGGLVHQEQDVLDTWFSSWLWPFATLGWPNETADLKQFYPGHTLVTGPDIIFFWVARMVMAGYYFMRDTPFDTVYMNGIVRDPQHRAFSKSLGNGIDPMDVVELYGADAFRFTIVAGAAAGTDIIMDRNDLAGTFAAGRNFANKLWNIGRLILANIGDGSMTTNVIDPARLELADRWILSRCQRTIALVTESLGRFRLNDAANSMYHFLWDELADWYVEQVKPRLYGSAEGGEIARSVLLNVFQTALMLLHPVMPFITERMWANLPGRSAPLLAGTAWPRPNTSFIDEEAEDQFARVQALVSAVRTVRAEYGVAPGTAVPADVRPSSTAALEAFNAEQRTIERLAKLTELKVDGGSTVGAGAHQVLPDGSTVFVPLGAAIDVAKECARLTGELQRLDSQLAGVARKLANEEFLNRAPTDVVNRERDKERSWQEQREALAAKLQALGC